MENDTELEPTEAETPEGVDAQPTSTEEQEKANEANLAAQDFNNAIYAAVQEYQAKVPLNYMMKIVSAVQIDLQAALLGTNITYVTNKLEAFVDDRLKGNESKITLA